MKIDLYTKAVLTLIAIFLAIIALKPLAASPVSAADGKFAHIQFSSFGQSGWVYFFDQRTGDLWNLNTESDTAATSFRYLGRLEAMGKFRPAGSK